MKNKLKKILAFTITTLMLLSVLLPRNFAMAEVIKSYNFNNMTYKSSWGTNHSINNGAAEISFNAQYHEVKFNLPETLDMSQCTSVTFNASSPNGAIAFKLYDTAGQQAAVRYNFQANTSDCSFAPNSSAKVNSIGIMSLVNNSIKATVNSVTFKMNGSSPTITPTVTPTVTPGVTPSVTPSGTPTLLNTYGKIMYSGTAVNYNQLNNPSTLSAIKNHYNSISIENEMKPDAVLNSTPIQVSAAKARGYYIPDGYTESTVPTFNFNTIDNILRICYNNQLKLRAHCLVWHSQTPDWFFKTGYSSNGSYVSQSVMNARMEMFIKTYMNHLHNSEYGSVVYAWDVVNEYLHANTSGWSRIYGSNLGTKPSFVKSAFQYAHECLTTLGLRDKVHLFYNDYNTYMVVNDIISLVSYINADEKLCDGVGMQSHLDTSYPSVDYYKAAMKSFLDAGMEVQVTELDVTNKSSAEQAKYVYDLFSAIFSLKKAGCNITGITWWGLYDSVSWRSSQNPLVFTSMTATKPSFTSVIKAFTDAGYTY